VLENQLKDIREAMDSNEKGIKSERRDFEREIEH
jgi:hypothetical protein